MYQSAIYAFEPSSVSDDTVFELSVLAFIRSDIVTTTSYEWFQQF